MINNIFIDFKKEDYILFDKLFNSYIMTKKTAMIQILRYRCLMSKEILPKSKIFEDIKDSYVMRKYSFYSTFGDVKRVGIIHKYNDIYVIYIESLDYGLYQQHIKISDDVIDLINCYLIDKNNLINTNDIFILGRDSKNNTLIFKDKSIVVDFQGYFNNCIIGNHLKDDEYNTIMNLQIINNTL